MMMMMMMMMIYRAESEGFKIDRGARIVGGHSFHEGFEEFSYSGQSLTNNQKPKKTAMWRALRFFRLPLISRPV